MSSRHSTCASQAAQGLAPQAANPTAATPSPGAFEHPPPAHQGVDVEAESLVDDLVIGPGEGPAS